MQKPLRNLVGGELVRTLLIQVRGGEGRGVRLSQQCAVWVGRGGQGSIRSVLLTSQAGLAQVQKLKVDTSSAMLEMDQVLKVR